VRDVRRQVVEVVLGQDPALVQDQEPVGVRLIEQLGDAQLTVAGAEPEVEDVTLGARQRPGRPGRARDPRRGDQLADMLERPPVERRILPVRQRHLRLRRERRRPAHQRGACRRRVHAGRRRSGESRQRRRSSTRR
jgi:hypothetical protein